MLWTVNEIDLFGIGRKIILQTIYENYYNPPNGNFNEAIMLYQDNWDAD